MHPRMDAAACRAQHAVARRAAPRTCCPARPPVSAIATRQSWITSESWYLCSGGGGGAHKEAVSSHTGVCSKHVFACVCARARVCACHRSQRSTTHQDASICPQPASPFGEAA